jgi:catechol 2,3-dioxygenase-like lactoylglutathione lyase family enzyme
VERGVGNRRRLTPTARLGKPPNARKRRLAATSGNAPASFPRTRSKIEGVSPPVTLPLIDHLALRVRDERRSRTFYEQALEPFGVKVMESSRGPGFAIEGGGDFWIEEGEPPAAPVHVAFAAADRATVDKFHRAAVEAGGRDNGAPGLRPQYHAGYYAAFVIDPDGNNVEAVFHGDRQLPAT